MATKLNVRPSKFRHMFATPMQLRDCYQDIRIGTCSPESFVLKANSTYLGLPWDVAGSIYISPLDKVGAADEEPALFINEEGEGINEWAFHPFRDDMFATACQNGHVYFWEIPSGGLSQSTRTPMTDVEVSSKRLLDLSFHPLASDVMCLSLVDKYAVKIYDVTAQQERITLPESHKGMVSNIDWSYEGNLLATSCKDKQLRVFDPRANSVVANAPDHQGAKSFKCYWLHDKPGQLVTIGFTKANNREIAVWDHRNMSARMGAVQIDNNTSSPLCFYDPDLGILYQSGKGDGMIRFYEINDTAPYVHYLNQYTSKEPAAGMAKLSKGKFCNIAKCEVARVLKLTPMGQIIPIRIEVPRANMDMFQDDLFPDTADGSAVCTSSDWFSGATQPPRKISLRPSGMP